MLKHELLDAAVIRSLIRQKKIRFAGNSQLRIYGTLACGSGKRMKSTNRVFFETAKDAEANGYRPCGNCMRKEYQNWKNGSVQ